MIAGKMRSMLRVFKPEAARNAYGEKALSYKDMGLIHAERLKESGVATTEAGGVFNAYTVQYNIRYPHKIEETWRVEELGGRLYTVDAVYPNIERGMKTLVCTKVNE